MFAAAPDNTRGKLTLSCIQHGNRAVHFPLTIQAIVEMHIQGELLSGIALSVLLYWIIILYHTVYNAMYFICLSHNLLDFHSTYKLKIYISDMV